MGSTERVVFTIRGLTCASCAVDVGRALGKTPGIAEININYMADKGYVVFDPGRIGWDDVAKALEGRGYVVMRRR